MRAFAKVDTCGLLISRHTQLALGLCLGSRRGPHLPAPVLTPTNTWVTAGSHLGNIWPRAYGTDRRELGGFGVLVRKAGDEVLLSGMDGDSGPAGAAVHTGSRGCLADWNGPKPELVLHVEGFSCLHVDTACRMFVQYDKAW